MSSIRSNSLFRKLNAAKTHFRTFKVNVEFSVGFFNSGFNNEFLMMFFLLELTIDDSMLLYQTQWMTNGCFCLFAFYRWPLVDQIHIFNFLYSSLIYSLNNIKIPNEKRNHTQTHLRYMLTQRVHLNCKRKENIGNGEWKKRQNGKTKTGQTTSFTDNKANLHIFQREGKREKNTQEQIKKMWTSERSSKEKSAV